MGAELIVSLSGTDYRTLGATADLRRDLAARGVPVSLFVTPRQAGGYRLDRDEAAAAWLRGQRAAGDAVVLHGFDEGPPRRRRGEFATLPAHEASLRLIAADRMLEQAGLRTRLFAGPGWMTSAGTQKALPCNGFRLLIGRHGTTDLVRGTVTRSPLLGSGAGFLPEPWWCRALVLSAERTARRGGPVRIAIATRQLATPGFRQAVLDAVDLALLHDCRPSVYRWGGDPVLAGAA